MKIMKIFGLVVAVHAAVFMLIFAIPGCRSSGRRAAAPAAESTAPSPSIAYAPSAGPSAALAGNELNPAITPAPFADPSATGGSVRFSPTRPGAAPAAPVAAAAEPTTITYSVVKGDSLWTVAKRHGVTVGELAAINNLQTNATLQLNQKLVIPQKAAPAAAPAADLASAPPAAEGTGYTVKSGDTLGAIARRNGTTAEALRTLNRLSSDILRPGQVLMLPAGATAPEAATAATAPAAGGRATSTVTHVVAPGETLGAIARRYGVRYAEIATANNITDPTRVRAGQELVIPGWQAPAGAPAAAATNATAPAAAPAAAPAGTIPTISLIIPGADQNLPPTQPANDVPVIRVDEGGSSRDTGAPRIN